MPVFIHLVARAIKSAEDPSGESTAEQEARTNAWLVKAQESGAIIDWIEFTNHDVGGDRNPVCRYVFIKYRHTEPIP
jgi:hypothetical protein